MNFRSRSVLTAFLTIASFVLSLGLSGVTMSPIRAENALSLSTTDTHELIIPANHQIYKLSIPLTDDVRSFHYSVLKNGIVWVMPLTLQNPGEKQGITPYLYTGKWWSIYFTPIFKTKAHVNDLRKDTVFQGHLPTYIQSQGPEEITQIRETNGYVLIYVEVISGAQGYEKVYYLNENTANPRMNGLAQYEFAGGTSSYTFVSNGYFILAQKILSNRSKVEVFDFSTKRFYRVRSYIKANISQWPTLKIMNHRLFYIYTEREQYSVPLP